MIGNQVTAHTGSTKTKTYKLVTAIVTGYEKKILGPNHYVLMYVLTDAEGVEYKVAESRIVETVATAAELAQTNTVEEATENTDTVWVPVSKNAEVELTHGQVWKIAAIANRFRAQVQAEENYASRRTIRELRSLGLGLKMNEAYEIAEWAHRFHTNRAAEMKTLLQTAGM